MTQTATASTSLLSRANRWIYWRLHRFSKRMLFNRHHVYRFDPAAPPPRPVDGLTLSRFVHDTFVGEEIESQIRQYYGQRAVERDIRQLSQGAVLWVGYLESFPVACTFTLMGQQFNQWFIDLKDDDIVIYRGRTHPDYRGRGIFPNMYRPIAAGALTPGATMYTDVHVQNIPSIKNVTKAGFERIATMKPISREAALGSGRD